MHYCLWCVCACMYVLIMCVCVGWLQVVVESGVVPKLVPLLASDENKIVVRDPPLLQCDYCYRFAWFNALMECRPTI